jgi:hypothetical protein
MTELEELKRRHNKFVYLVQLMRNAQRTYFATKNPSALQESIRLEKIVDTEVARDIEAQKQGRLL